MSNPEPDAVASQILSGELAVQVDEESVTLFIPWAILDFMGIAWVMGEAQNIYGHDVILQLEREILSWDCSTSILLPALHHAGGTEGKLEALKHVIRAKYRERTKGKTRKSLSRMLKLAKPAKKDEVSGPVKKPKPAESAEPVMTPPKEPELPKTPKPEKPAMPVPTSFERMEWVVEPGDGHTKLSIDLRFVVRVGLRDIHQLVEKVYGSEALKSSSIQKQEPNSTKRDLLILILPPAPRDKGNRPLPDPRHEQFRQLLIVACRRR